MHPVILLAIAFVLLLFGAIFSGLNIGLMMVRPAELKRKAKQGDKVAARLYRYRKNGTYLIVCILLGGVAVVAALSIILESLFGGLIAGIVTTGVVTVFGEILPQTIFVRYGYRFNRYFFWLLDIIFVLFYPIAKPLTLMLDRVLGKELPTVFTREEITHLVEEHAHTSDSAIDVDESRIVQGALQYSTLGACDVMTPLKHIDSVSIKDTIDVSMLSRLKRCGHSRFPVQDEGSGDFLGILYMKDLLGEELPTPVSHAYRDKIYSVPEESPLDTVLSRFIQTKSHLFLVRSNDETVAGIITIEDVIERILNRDIADEFDRED
ncbi:MAG TPA: CNNM domain-containing protein [Candidatus Limnocylindrales bacterium]|nr:CNNM domain-containing protein [Candidatus Limnocylindrales bacterium]